MKKGKESSSTGLDQTSQKKTQKFLMIGPKTKTLINFRGDLLCDIKRRGYDVVVVAPEDDNKDFFEKNKIRLRQLSLNKNSVSLFDSLTYCKKMRQIIEEEQPDKVFSYTIKPVIFGSIAAKRAGVEEIYSLICGLGLLYSSNALSIRILRMVAGILYRYALKYNDKVFFQNRDDIEEFTRRGYVPYEKCELVNGSGVNLERFKRNKIPKNKISFLMVSRVLKEKGVLEYFEAAKIVKKKYPEAEFVYVGAIDKNKNAIGLDILRPYNEAGIVEYVPETNEVAKYVAESSVFVLPTYYREGIPRTLLEATAMGRPIITTKTPGCKEVVTEGKNGLFVKVRDSQDLADKMIFMIKNQEKLQEMGDKSYELCLEKFDVDIVNGGMLKIMEI